MKNKTIFVGLSIVVLVVLISFLTYGNRGSSSNKNEIRIAALLPLTGTSAIHGEYAKRGIEMAVDELKTEVNVVPVFDDTQMDPKIAVSDFNKETQSGVNAILSLGSPVAMAIKPLSSNSKTLLMSIVSAPAYSSPNDYTFRINGTATLEMDNILNTINDLGITKLAVVYQNDDYGRGLLSSLKRVYDRPLSSEEGFLPDSTDMRTLLTKVKASHPDGIFVAAYAKSVGLVMKQSKDLGIKVTFICGSACDNPDLLTSGGSNADGLIIVSPTPNAHASFADKYSSLYGEDTNFVSIRMYDAVKMIVSAVQECQKSSDMKMCLKDQMHSVKDFPGAAFAVNFDQNGDMQDQFVQKTVKDGKIVLKK